MASYVIIVFIATILASTISRSSAFLMNPENANILANKMRTLNSKDLYPAQEIDNSRLTELYTTHLTNKLPDDQITLVADKITFINYAIRNVESHFKVFQQFNNRYNELQKLPGQFAKIKSDFEDVEDSVKDLDEKLYSEPLLFDLLVRNKDSTTDCVTEASSIEPIRVLYNSILEFEIRKHASALYARDMQAKLGTNVDLASEDVLKSGFQQRIDKLYKTASDAINSAEKELEKCAEKK